ncbi:hypothetical protein QYM36_005444 [Artemia franciscana]|uniref:Uncharacterized protein n=1 Tax=Artemia franciscana TaxID=6661 RepID=A0AA88L5Y2_ARTSF|nr:hypothetical protein QYM36_005444 [Artemia franciscana]
MTESRIIESDDYEFKCKKVKTSDDQFQGCANSNLVIQNNPDEQHQLDSPNFSDYLSQRSDIQKVVTTSREICEDIVQLDYSKFPPLEHIPAKGCVIAFKGPNSHHPDSLNYKQAVVYPIKRAPLGTYCDWFMSDQFSPSSKESDMIESSFEDLVSPVILQYSYDDLCNG